MGRLIDADKLLETLQDLEPHCENKDYEYGMLNTMRYYMPKIINDEPTVFDVDKVVEQLESLRNAEADYYYASSNDVIDRDDAIEIVKQEAAEYEECYKDCGECEAYNKEKHHCPKFCKVIKETVKEIEENHNIKGKWEMTYKGKRKDVNTGLMISAYNCKCSVCGWETGNQGTRFSYCPNCGAKMDEVNKPNGE